jgi:hypothetical protein
LEYVAEGKSKEEGLPVPSAIEVTSVAPISALEGTGAKKANITIIAATIHPTLPRLWPYLRSLMISLVPVVVGGATPKQHKHAPLPLLLLTFILPGKVVIGFI